ncbi:MAG: alpha/beta hydrolase [Deltaproteobacteria bacterium]|nr:alpha/beta hydrolase [Deltaproteobacteria bacterium]
MLQVANHLARQRLWARGFRSRYVATSVGKVHVLEAAGQGSLPPVVFLHGLSAAAHYFGRLLTSTAPHVQRVWAPDLPGHGFSELPRHVPPVLAMQEALLETLDALLERPAVLFGSSMGGFAAVRYAAARPERVRGLVLSSPGGAAMDPEALDRFLRGFRLESHREALGFVDRFMAHRTWKRPFLAWGVRRSMAHPSVSALLQDMRTDALLKPEQLQGLGMPVLLLWGQAERVLPDEAYQFFRRNLPAHAEVERPPHYGHAPYLEHPRCVGNKLLGFLRRLEPDIAPEAPRRRRRDRVFSFVTRG